MAKNIFKNFLLAPEEVNFFYIQPKDAQRRVLQVDPGLIEKRLWSTKKVKN